MLFGAFPTTEATPEALEAYLLAVGDLPINCVKLAVVKAIREDKWLPRASELRAHAKSFLPKRRDPYLEKLLKDGRKRQVRPAIDYRPKVSPEIPKIQISQQEIERRRQEFLTELDSGKQQGD